jgi:membrane associated rhomboid family serine protease
MEESITLIELLEVIILFSLPVSLIGIIIQLIYLKFGINLPVKKIIFIILGAQIICWILTGIIWLFWPFKIDPMLGFFCIPTIISELIIIATFFFVFKKSTIWV